MQTDDNSPDNSAELTPIAELFARDPGKYSEQDIVRIIEDLRSKRARFKQGDKTAGRTKPTKTSKVQSEAVEATGKLNLDELGL